MARAAAPLAESTRETLTSLPFTKREAAVRLRGRTKHRVFLDGGPFTGVAARHLAVRLMRLRDEVHMLPGHPVHLNALVQDLRRTDVLVLFDHRLYEERMARVAQEAKTAGARIVLFTDLWFSPVTALADVVLAAAVRCAMPGTGLVPTSALIETLLAVRADSGEG